MKKILTPIIIVFTFLLLALWSPWVGWNLNFERILGVDPNDEVASLQVFSLSGDLEVYVDGELKGTATKENSPFIVDRVDPGERLINLKRVLDNGEVLGDVSQIIEFIDGTSVIFSYQIGPSEIFTQGHDIYAVEKQNENDPNRLKIVTSVEGVSIQIDDLPIQEIAGNTFTENINFDTQHKIVVSKQGYETLEFVILPETQEEREELKKYDINIDVKLMLQPLTVQ